MFPHMHLRGKSFRYEADYPDGTSETLLSVPRYDFHWQHRYVLSSSEADSRRHRSLRCIAHYDNSSDNPANPDPDATVRTGKQSTDEMFNGYFDVALADQEATRATLPLISPRPAPHPLATPLACLFILAACGLVLHLNRNGRAHGAKNAGATPTASVSRSRDEDDGELDGKRRALPQRTLNEDVAPIIWASFLVIASPSPVPPYFREVEASAWVKGRNIRPICSGVMPMPLSRTRNTTRSPSAPFLAHFKVIVPPLVNLQAFDSRLSRHCRSRVVSLNIVPRPCRQRSRACWRSWSPAAGWMTRTPGSARRC